METDNTFVLTIKTARIGDLDTFASCACQGDNFGNANNWFLEFRGGLFGFDSRILAIKKHFDLVHQWIPNMRDPAETEYHVASILFGMDSAMECFVYMLNALGFGTKLSEFRDVGDPDALSKVSPKDILGSPRVATPAQPGYATFFPSVQTHWLSNRDLVFTIMDLHDVSKHRRTICTGGQLRSDPPPGFYESLGVANDKNKEVLVTPHAKILVEYDPKKKTGKSMQSYEERPVLEDLVHAFCHFIEQSCILALDDARANICLPGSHPDLTVEGVRSWIRDGDE